MGQCILYNISCRYPVRFVILIRKMGKRKAPTQKSKPSDDNSKNSSKAEKTLASATEKNPVKAKTPVKEKKTKATEKKAPTKAEKQENELKKIGKIPNWFVSVAD